MWVVVPVTVLVLMGVAAGWLGLTMLTVADAVGESGVRSSGVQFRALFLVVNALGNLALVYPLLRGVAAARWAAAGICGWWVFYWLWKCTELSDLTGSLSAAPLPIGLGAFGTMLTLGVLLLCGLAGGSAGLLWTASSSRHFAAR